ncbi:MAG: hypothetical protein HQL11_05155, partial [Candidatus Omnitrophica bacterium]|nr:hypothetical protein [Candidatus Omnitrophota bacterium]
MLTAGAMILQGPAMAAPRVHASAATAVLDAAALETDIPRSLALVEDRYQSTAPGAPKIYLIQDAHSNPSGQLNLSLTLERLLESHPGIRTVFVEGGRGENSVSFVRQYGTAEQRRREALNFLNKGGLHGEEFLNMTSDRDFVIRGVEDLTLYAEALELYGDVVRRRPEAESVLARIRVAVSALRPDVLNTALLDWVRICGENGEEEGMWMHGLDSLMRTARKERIALKDYPHLR